MKFFDRIQMFSHRSFAPFAKVGKTKIAVVGNAGLQPEDQEAIDGADCIIRFNNYATRAGIDYTADRFQCDMLWTTGDLHSEGADPHSVVLGIPFPFKAETLPQRVNKWYPKSVPYCVNPWVNHQMNKELMTGSFGFQHPFPSIGFTCLWHLHHLFKTIPNFQARIYVAGFTWYSDNEGKTIQGIKPTKDYDVTKHRHLNHHYVMEASWMARNLLEHKDFGFSDKCWRTLETVARAIK